MPDLKLYAGPTKLVLAFDIGTTYSGVSYCILEPRRVPEVLAVARFPAQGVARSDAKVPSLLYYDKSGAVRAAGAEVLTQGIIETAQTEGWTKAEWWKLHLCPRHLASSTDDLPPLPPGKSAVDVLTDFIKYLVGCCKTYIRERHPAFTWSSVEDSIEYILTYPGGWGEQQHLYRQAVELAGLVPNMPGGQFRVHTLTEGEASLHFCVPRLLGGKTVVQASPQGVVVIDAGGGIVDLSMFSMVPNPFSCKEIAPAECQLQGSVFVTRRAKALIERKLEGWEHSNPEDIARFTREFDQRTKLVIGTDRESAYIRVAGRRVNSPGCYISSGQLELSGEEATGVFNDSVDAIIRAFEQQKKFAVVPITTAFLVGGLSTNDWVWSRLQSYFAPQKIRIYRPDYHICKAVAKGAVLSRIAREDRLGATTFRDRLSRNFTRVLMLARKCKWTDPARFGMQTKCVVCHRGSLSSDPKWVDQDQYELVIGPSFSPWYTVRAHPSKRTKYGVPLSGVSVPNPEFAEREGGIKEKLGSRDQSKQAVSRHGDAVDLAPPGHPYKPDISCKVRSESIHELSNDPYYALDETRVIFNQPGVGVSIPLEHGCGPRNDVIGENDGSGDEANDSKADTSPPPIQIAPSCTVMAPCRWINEETSETCGAWVDCKTVCRHFLHTHIERTEKIAKVRCMWEGCYKSVQRKNFVRHIRETHLNHRRGEKASCS